jgi:outer membrane protein assembly factor BamB
VSCRHDSQAELFAYDFHSKKAFRYALPTPGPGYGLTTGLDGKVYVGMIGRLGGNMVQFDPKTGSMRDLGKAGQPTTYIWQCATGPDGKIFGAGYPKCIPLIYDPKTDKLTSPGSIAPHKGIEYLRCVVTDAKGRAWFGAGTHAALVVYDPADGSHRDVLPKQYRDQTFVIEIVRAGNRVYASILPSGKVLVFDVDSCEFLREIPAPPDKSALLAVACDSKGNVYGSTQPGGHLYVIRPGSSQAEKLVPFLGLVKSILEDRYLHVIFDDQHRIYDLQTKEVVDQSKWIKPKFPLLIGELARGPEDKIYGAPMTGQHFFRYDPDTGKLEDLGRTIHTLGRCDSLCRSRDGKRLWMGHYTWAYLSMYDPTKPYKIGTGPDCNPRDFGPIEGQGSTRAIVEGPLGKIYVGTIPRYKSSPTGALVVFNPKSMKKKIMTDLVPGGSVLRLAANDEFVYGSGGGQLFVLDPQTARKIKQRDLGCDAMLITSDGTLVVSTSDGVQGLDPKTLETNWSIPFSRTDGLRRFSQMTAGPHGKKLYGINDQGIFQVDVAASKFIQLAKTGQSFSRRHGIVSDKDGRLYLTTGRCRRENGTVPLGATEGGLVRPQLVRERLLHTYPSQYFSWETCNNG